MNSLWEGIGIHAGLRVCSRCLEMYWSRGMGGNRVINISISRIHRDVRAGAPCTSDRRGLGGHLTMGQTLRVVLSRRVIHCVHLGYLRVWEGELGCRIRLCIAGGGLGVRLSSVGLGYSWETIV